jgi:SPX domain protein involved in polyphosphate accumulation
MIDEQQAGHNALTRGRSEAKYFVPAHRVGRLAATLDAHLKRHEVTHADERDIVDHWVATIYFDTPSHQIYHEQIRERNALKLRAREYYDVLDPLTELATSADDAVSSSRLTWLEIKWREGGRTKKRRAAIRRSQIPALLRVKSGDSERRFDDVSGDAELQDVEQALSSLAERFGEPLVATCVVSYRRWAWQNADDSVRITLDTHLCGYRVDERLWTLNGPLTRTNLGDPDFSFPQAILEVKTLGDAPAWLLALRESCELEAATLPEFAHAPFSKFLRVGQALQAQG